MTGFGAGADGVAGLLAGGEVDVDVGGRGGGVRGVRLVDEDGDGGLEDVWILSVSVYGVGESGSCCTKTFQLVRSGVDFLKDIFKRLRTVLVGAQQGIEDSLEKTSPSMCRMKYPDGGYGDGKG